MKLRRNELAPELGGRFEYSRNLGELTGTEQDFTLPGNVFKAGLELSMPLRHPIEAHHSVGELLRLAEEG